MLRETDPVTLPPAALIIAFASSRLRAGKVPVITTVRPAKIPPLLLLGAPPCDFIVSPAVRSDSISCRTGSLEKKSATDAAMAGTTS